MEMSVESALSVLSDPAVLALEGALITAWALAELRIQKRANQAREIFHDKAKELWAQQAALSERSECEWPFRSMASTFEALSLESVYGSLPRMSLPTMPTLPNLSALPFSMPTLPNLRPGLRGFAQGGSAGNESQVSAPVVMDEAPELEFLNLDDVQMADTGTSTAETMSAGSMALLTNPPSEPLSMEKLVDPATLQDVSKGTQAETVAMTVKADGVAPTRQKRKPRTKEQLERCRQESARARERKRAERGRLERVVAQRTEDCDRLRASVAALQAEAQALRQSLLEGTLLTLTQIPDMDPAAAHQALATAQLCAQALQSPALFAAMTPLQPLPKVGGPQLREIRPRPSIDNGMVAETLPMEC